MYSITKNTRKHFDLIKSITKEVERSPLTWKFIHLDGHQDDHKAYGDLDRWAQLNVIVDKSAKAKLSLILRSQSSQGNTILIPHSTCTVSQLDDNGDQQLISSHMATTILQRLQQGKLMEYWKEKKQLSEESAGKVDWEVLTKSAKNYARTKWLSKFVTGICGVGYMLKLWKHQAHDSCPRCGQEKETTQHVIQCKEESATKVWEEAVEHLDTWMTDNQADPTMQDYIIASLKGWRNGNPTPHAQRQQTSIREASEDQNLIGWHNLISGFISKQWRLIQQTHLKEIGSMKSPILWISRFQRRIWEIPWALWQHRNDSCTTMGRRFISKRQLPSTMRSEQNMKHEEETCQSPISTYFDTPWTLSSHY